jgi:hypothetical protein
LANRRHHDVLTLGLGDVASRYLQPTDRGDIFNGAAPTILLVGALALLPVLESGARFLATSHIR